jgi:hypothetical protein
VLAICDAVLGISGVDGNMGQMEGGSTT